MEKQAGAEQVLATQPTAFDNCLQLSDVLRVRWSITDNGTAVEIGLEGEAAEDMWLGFGPADPTATSRLMGGADVIIAGIGGGGADDDSAGGGCAGGERSER